MADEEEPPVPTRRRRSYAEAAAGSGYRECPISARPLPVGRMPRRPDSDDPATPAANPAIAAKPIGAPVPGKAKAPYGHLPTAAELGAGATSVGRRDPVRPAASTWLRPFIKPKEIPVRTERPAYVHTPSKAAAPIVVGVRPPLPKQEARPHRAGMAPSAKWIRPEPPEVPKEPSLDAARAEPAEPEPAEPAPAEPAPAEEPTKDHSSSTEKLRARLAVKNQRRRRQAREEKKRKLEEQEAAAAAEKRRMAAEKRAATLEARRRQDLEVARQHASAPIVVSSEQSLHELGQLAVAQERLREAADRLGRGRGKSVAAFQDSGGSS
ncbi:unnamed protein product [Symbiodinium sp. CCMP2592]|nr:unnamed protein product [Symbiodinium sp. CCMP2592]